MTRYNTRERPRAVVVGAGNRAPRLVEAVEKLAGWSDERPLGVQPLHERDVVIAWQPGSGHSMSGVELGHLRVLQFGGEPISQRRFSEYGTLQPALADALGDEIDIPDTCPNALRDVVKATLIPLLERRLSERRVITAGWGRDQGAELVPLLRLGGGANLAAIYSHPDIGEVWWLPVEPGDDLSFDFESWISAAFETWHEADPERFPGPPDWTRSRDWMTHHELELQAEVDAAESQRDEELAELNARFEDRAQALAAAQVEHDGAERMLLTEQGENLVAAVKAMLERIGFQVENVDHSRAGQQKLQDLNVCDPGGPWTALAEVKGYDTSGGKPGDLRSIARFVGIYEGQHGKPPDASWYVVNQQRLRPPERRRVLMSNHQEDAEQFAREDNGVVIDTRDLFILDRMVSSGRITVEDAKRRLMDARRRFELQEDEQPGEG
jgi:hypothetical protein